MIIDIPESGGLGDRLRAITQSHDASGAIAVMYERLPWTSYNMPYPTCDDDLFSNARSCPIVKTGDRWKHGRRWCQADQWRSSCDIHFQQLLVPVKYAVEAVNSASWFPPNNEAHVDPCTFRAMYVDAMSMINRLVGSRDVTNGVEYAMDSEGLSQQELENIPKYVPRNLSLIFGGADFNNNYPYYNNPHQGMDDIYYRQDEDGNRVLGSFDQYPMETRILISNAEYCREYLNKSYPCGENVRFPQMCPRKCLRKTIIGCVNNHCPNHPLEYYDLYTSELRSVLVDSVRIYEQKNQSILMGKTLDYYCAEQFAKNVARAPEVDKSGFTKEEVAAFVTYEQGKVELEQKANEDRLVAELTKELLGDGETAEEAPPSLVPIALGAAALVGGLIFLNRRRGR